MADYLLPAKSIPVAADLTIGDDLIVVDDVTIQGLDASKAVFTDADKLLVSVAATGTGSVVRAGGPTLTGTITAESATLSGKFAQSVSTGVTAFAGGGQASATAITSAFTVVATSATHLDSVKLPSDAVVGSVYTIINNGAKDVAVYPHSGGAINSASADAYRPLASGVVQRYLYAASNQWYALNRGALFVSSGDPAANDFTQADLTMDGAYNNLDLSSKIPPSAYGRRVKLKVRITHSAAREINLRTDGNSNAINVAIARTQVAADNNGEEVEVITSSTGGIEYNVAAATTAIVIHVLGWYVEA